MLFPMYFLHVHLLIHDYMHVFLLRKTQKQYFKKKPENDVQLKWFIYSQPKMPYILLQNLNSIMPYISGRKGV